MVQNHNAIDKGRKPLMTTGSMDVLKDVSFLENSYKYFLENVLILRFDNFYRLLVVHENEILTDRKYKSPKRAKTAFIKLYDSQKWKESDEPEWSDFFEPGSLRDKKRAILSNYLTRWDKRGPDMTAGRKGIVRVYNKQRDPKKKDTANPVEKAVCLVLSTPNGKLKEITKNDFSKASGIDYRLLEVKFKKERNLCPFDFIRREKLHRAAMTLEHNQSISIAYLSRFLGFDSKEDFETAFNEYFCIKPKRYREIKNPALINHGGRR